MCFTVFLKGSLHLLRHFQIHTHRPLMSSFRTLIGFIVSASAMDRRGSPPHKAPQHFSICSFRFFSALYSGFSFFRPPPGFRNLYALFSPIIIRAAPAAVHPGHGRKSSSCRCNHPHGLAHIQCQLPPVL